MPAIDYFDYIIFAADIIFISQHADANMHFIYRSCDMMSSMFSMMLFMSVAIAPLRVPLPNVRQLY